MTIIQWEHGKRILDHPLVFKAVVGSHNYNLNVPESDTDWKAYVAPSFTELFNEKPFHFSIIGETEDVEVHDIRKLMAHLRKSNINFVETLFSCNFIGNNEYYDEVTTLVDMRHDIARMNLQYFYKANNGMYIEKMKKWEKTGNYKELMTAFRVLDFLIKFSENDFQDMGKVMRYDEESKEFLTEIRYREYNEESVRKLLSILKTQVDNLEHRYFSATVNETTYKKLYDVIFSIVEKQIKKELN